MTLNMRKQSAMLLIQGISYCIRGLKIPVAVAAIGIISIACGTGSSSSTRTSVVTTLYPLEYFAQQIGGEEVSVTNLLKPGVEAHSFEPTPADIRKLDSADVILYNGPAFEPWMDRALEAIGSRGGPRLVIEASYGWVKENYPGEMEPHVWLDPFKAMDQVKLIRDGLSSADPDGAARYATNAQELLDRLSALDQRLVTGLDGCRQDHFVTSHAAFGHLAARYGLTQVPISGFSPEAEPGAGDMASIADTIRELGVEYIMVEPLISPAFAETLAREVGAELLPLHPLESLTPEQSKDGEDYFSLMDANLESLRLALGCGT